ncbi:MAG: cbb3-type cytochrome c oxidase subunit I [Opitutae bacterium]|nr:cbb3-type cytochrome c oxidase subunit I [Opitutae bacterium]
MNAPATPSSASSNDEPVAVETQARWALLLLLALGIKWFVAGGFLALIHSIQLHTPEFLARYEWFTFGRVQAAAESALVFGWVANVGFAIAWWLLGRLGGERPRGAVGALIGVAFWNAGVTVGVIGILAGDLGPYALLQMPAYVFPLLGAAYAAFGVAGLAAWLDRRRADTYAAQWYASAAIFALPWFYSAAYAMLSLYPVTGVSQAIVGAWAGEGLRLVWIAPLALAAAYYLVPKLNGQKLAAYNYADVGFWALIVLAPWVGTRALVGGPVPVWVPTVGVSCTLLLTLHYLIVASNFKAVFRRGSPSQALRFVLVGIAAYLASGLTDTALAFRSVAQYTQFTYLGEARLTLLVLGVFTPIAFGALYFLLPRLTGRAWASDGLIRTHFRATWIGLLILIAGLVGAGLTQGTALVAIRAADGQIAAQTFAEIFAATRPWLLTATLGLGLELLGGVLLLVNGILQLVPASDAAHSDTLASAPAS